MWLHLTLEFLTKWIYCGIWAADLFVVQTLTFRTLYVFFCIRHERRELLHFNVTASLTAVWIWHQLLEATSRAGSPSTLSMIGTPCMGATLTVT